jgi:hypothetical protein
MCRSRFDWRDPRSSSRARGWGERVRGSRVPRARGFPVSAAADFGRPRRKRARRSPRATWYSGKPPGVEPDAKIGIEGKNEGALAAERVRAPERGDALPPTPAELHFLSSMPVFSAGGITGSLVLACVCGGKNVRVRVCPSATQPHAWLSQIGGAGPRPVPRDRERRAGPAMPTDPQAVRCTQLARDGMPSRSVRKSMYHPGGARFGSFGTVTERRQNCRRRRLIGRSTRRCSLSHE